MLTDIIELSLPKLQYRPGKKSLQSKTSSESNGSLNFVGAQRGKQNNNTYNLPIEARLAQLVNRPSNIKIKAQEELKGIKK